MDGEGAALFRRVQGPQSCGLGGRKIRLPSVPLLSRRPPRAVGSEPLGNALQDGLNLARRHGLAEVEALHVASGHRDGAQVIERLDTFGDRAHPQLLCQTGDRVNYGHAIGALRAVKIPDEASIDLDLVEREAAQVAERGVGRTEVIKADLYTETPELVQRILNLGLVTQEHRFRLNQVSSRPFFTALYTSPFAN